MLGAYGERLIIQELHNRGIHAILEADPFATPADLRVYPDFPDNKRVWHCQVKTKATWVYEGAQTVEDWQWKRYQNLDRLFFICAPAPKKYAEKDKWAGNIYMFKPNEMKVTYKQTRSDREMVMIKLDDYEPLDKLSPEIIEDMQDYITEET